MRSWSWLWLAAVIAIASMGTGCITVDNGKLAPLQPSMVSPQFKDLDAKAKNPFVKPASRVTVLKVGIPTYDKFFQDVAEVKGTMVLADVVLKETDVFIAKMKKDIAGSRVLTPDQTARINKQQARMDALTNLLKALPNRSGKLLDQSGGLASGAPKTFIGPNAGKLPGVVRGLDESQKNLRDAATRGPQLLSHAQKTSAALVGLK